jgi:hypothetical protein
MVLGLNFDPEEEARRRAAIQARAQQTAQAAAGPPPAPARLATPRPAPALVTAPEPALVTAPAPALVTAPAPAPAPAPALAPAPKNQTEAILRAAAGGGFGRRAEGEPPGFFERLEAGFKEDPIGSIGLILAGIGGNTAAINAYNASKTRQAAQQSLAIDSAKLGISATLRGIEFLEKLPEDARQDFIRRWGAQHERLVPGFTDTFSAASQRPDGKGLASLAFEHQDALMEATNGNPELILKLIQDEDFMQMQNNNADIKNIPLASIKLNAIVGQLEQMAITNPEAYLQIPQSANGQLPFATIAEINAHPDLPPEAKITFSEMATLRRNEDILISAGVVPPSALEAFAVAQFTKLGELEATIGQFKTRISSEGRFEMVNNISGEVTILDDLPAPQKFEVLFATQDEARTEVNTLREQVLAGEAAGEPLGPDVLEQLTIAEQRFSDVSGMIAKEIEGGADKEFFELSLLEIDLQKQIETAEADGKTKLAASLRTRLDRTTDRLEFLTTRTGRTALDITQDARERIEIEAGEELITLELARAESQSLLLEVGRKPDVTGIRGFLANKMGIIEQGSPGLAQLLINMVATDVTAADAAAFRLRAETLVAQSISVITGEQSGRFTDVERRIAQLAVAASAPGSSAEQVSAALGEIWTLQTLERQVQLTRANRDLDFDVSTPEAQIALVGELKAIGLQEDQVIGMIRRLAIVNPALERERAARNRGEAVEEKPFDPQVDPADQAGGAGPEDEGSPF